MPGYSEADKKMMVRAAAAKNKSRLQELIDFAQISGFKKLGIANCKGVEEYAARLAELLRAAGFEVSTVNCKQSGLDAATLSPELKGPSCDPVFQAHYLNQQKTDFNINVGLCLGHGLLFQKHSNAEVTTFLVKDFATGHKTIDNLS